MVIVGFGASERVTVTRIADDGFYIYPTSFADVMTEAQSGFFADPFVIESSLPTKKVIGGLFLNRKSIFKINYLRCAMLMTARANRDQGNKCAVTPIIHLNGRLWLMSIIDEYPAGDKALDEKALCRLYDDWIEGVPRFFV